MSDEVTLFDKRLRKQAVVSVVAGLGLGLLAIQAQQISTGNTYPIELGLVYGVLATGALYGKMYRTLSKRHSQ